MARHEWMRPPNRDPSYLLGCVRRSLKRLEARPLTNGALIESLRRMEKVYAVQAGGKRS